MSTARISSATEPEDLASKVTRPRGRPRRDIDLSAVADAVADLFAEGGYENVSIGGTSEKLSISRATLYRAVPTKDHLLGILFERSTGELTEAAELIVKETKDKRETLIQLVCLHVEAAIEMRRYMAVFFGGGELPPDVFERWHEWSRGYEALWRKAVKDAMKAGFLDTSDPTLTTRLLLGMCIWISRWYRPEEGFSKHDIAQAAVTLIDRR